MLLLQNKFTYTDIVMPIAQPKLAMEENSKL